MSRLLYITATGNVGGALGGTIASIIVSANAAAAGVLTLREGGSGGTIFIDIASPVAGSQQYLFQGLSYGGQLHATLTGTGVTAAIEQA